LAASFISGQTNSGSSRRRRSSGQQAGLDRADRVDRDARRYRPSAEIFFHPAVAIRCLPWLEREFGWSGDTAERYMALSSDKFRNLRNLELSVSGLYLLAKPLTPDEARAEVCIFRSGNVQTLLNPCDHMLRMPDAFYAVPRPRKRRPQLAAPAGAAFVLGGRLSWRPLSFQARRTAVRPLWLGPFLLGAERRVSKEPSKFQCSQYSEHGVPPNTRWFFASCKVFVGQARRREKYSFHEEAVHSIKEVKTDQARLRGLTL
jgi:hypothetical protein